MIFILAGTYADARKWAAAQQLSANEWFSTLDVDDIKSRDNFHVVVLDSASELPPNFFERVYTVARLRGRVNRK